MITAVVSIRIQHREKTKKKKKGKRKKKANIKSARGFLSSYACCSSHPSRRLLFVYIYIILFYFRETADTLYVYAYIKCPLFRKNKIEFKEQWNEFHVSHSQRKIKVKKGVKKRNDITHLRFIIPDPLSPHHWSTFDDL